MISMDLITLNIITDFFSDLSFIIKLFALVAILGFLNQHIENKILKVIVALFMIYIVVFVDWATFGTLYVLYAIFGLGISSIFVDYFFMGGQGDHAKQQIEQGKMDIARRRAKALGYDYKNMDPEDFHHLGLMPEDKKSWWKRMMGG